MNDQVMSCIKSIPMSDTSAARRVDFLATHFWTDDAKLTMFTAVDESTVNSDTALLSLFVCVFDGDIFREDILGLIPLEGCTTGEIIFQRIVDFFLSQ